MYAPGSKRLTSMTKNQLAALIVLFVTIISAWLYLFYQHWQMTTLPMSAMWMPPSNAAAWHWHDFGLVYLMWATMMAAMMLPSAIPMILVYTRVSTQRHQQVSVNTLMFSLAYLLIWLVFSVALTLVQWQMHGLHFLTPMMVMQQEYLAAAIFLLAGCYQLTPLKTAFLRACRTPMGFLLTEWRDGPAGAFKMGLKHGGDCVGCCWAQMLIMFAVGVMSLVGMALITLLIMVEKTVPDRRQLFAKMTGLLFILWGLMLIPLE